MTSTTTTEGKSIEQEMLENRDLDSLQEEESVLKRKLKVFGKDVNEVPCFRNSFLYGISSGFAGGIIHFAFSSRIQSATKFGFYTYIAVTFGYWCHCRYRYTMIGFEYKQLQHAMRMNAMKVGTQEAINTKELNNEVEDK